MTGPPSHARPDSIVCAKVAQSCPTLCDPMDYTVHGVGNLQARILEWVASPFLAMPSLPPPLFLSLSASHPPCLVLASRPPAPKLFYEKVFTYFNWRIITIL